MTSSLPTQPPNFDPKPAKTGTPRWLPPSNTQSSQTQGPQPQIPVPTHPGNGGGHGGQSVVVGASDFGPVRAERSNKVRRTLKF